MGVSRDTLHKRRATGGKRHSKNHKRKHAVARPAANTKIGEKRVHVVRGRGGNLKYRALRLDHGLFSWGSENHAAKSKILNVVYNATNNELVRTNTLVKGSIVQIDAAPMREWYERTYGKDGAAKTPAQEKHAAKAVALEDELKTQLNSGRLLCCVSSRPGQVGRCDGYVLEGDELAFYLHKTQKKKHKEAK
mmetsp:Transcript_34455/g.71097  ORF Transcript_34455/g.71097 Transcript_34455/m.71097 type:complete len:192 (+) Transcript_34455:38-613(+)|eukprot:CAMPEP_0181325020 /NCGR_PEP_ID=MMETSP1101-20121128/20686_1 /TAXON_ID=46948 /ORGANISM="Rhodomonas abbreviata, Strain Caron Lab Isolate" /LENGTH=191 /DNA_ID=CAMNT_0023433267 /DNA_START=38 /DNA_END=613 /DNA_ORIENTATION=+